MEHPIRSLHHVTATVDDAQQDLDFCARLLGLRLVKKTVNFDNHHVYHFYYGNAQGTPGTIWTTFPYKGWNVPVGAKGAGQVTVTSFSVPEGSLPFWRARLLDSGVETSEVGSHFGEPSLLFDDPSGLVFELVATRRDGRTAWTTDDIDADAAIRGLHGVTLTVRSPERTIALLAGLLGFQVVGEYDGRTRVALGTGAPGQTLDIVAYANAPQARNGIGTVHHVALAITNADEQLRLRHELIQHGAIPTDVRDRCYFQSIYFREPGGVLLEVATMDPGFAIDESVEDLGTGLKLPPWEEPHREEIEQRLPPVTI